MSNGKGRLGRARRRRDGRQRPQGGGAVRRLRGGQGRGQGRVAVEVAVGVAGDTLGWPGLPRSPAEPGQTTAATCHVVPPGVSMRSRLAPLGALRPVAPPHSMRALRPVGFRRMNTSSPLARFTPE